MASHYHKWNNSTLQMKIGLVVAVLVLIDAAHATARVARDRRGDVRWRRWRSCGWASWSPADPGRTTGPAAAGPLREMSPAAALWYGRAMGMMTERSAGADAGGDIQLRARAWPGDVLRATPKRMRVVLGGETIADATHVQLSGVGAPAGLLLPARRTCGRTCSSRATATRAARRRARRPTTRSAPATGSRRPAPGTTRSRSEAAAPIKDLIAFYWQRMDHWFEEDEEIFVHAPRSLPPHRRIPEHAPRPCLARRRAAGREPAGAGAVRVKPADALVYPARGRRGRARAHRDGDHAARTRARRATTRSSSRTASASTI